MECIRKECSWHGASLHDFSRLSRLASGDFHFTSFPKILSLLGFAVTGVEHRLTVYAETSFLYSGGYILSHVPFVGVFVCISIDVLFATSTFTDATGLLRYHEWRSARPAIP